jgi:hypothetical protein
MNSWILMPVVDCVEYTVQAAKDCLAQVSLQHEPRLLIIDNGSGRAGRRGLEALAVGSRARVLCWFHNPPLGDPPLGTVNASWNAGLDFIWRQGATEALVVNNDVRLRPETYFKLLVCLRQAEALFVSAVGVLGEQYDHNAPIDLTGALVNKGGPDFSCFVISRECHDRFRFDEQFTYFGDNDYHRRLKLAGQGDRIFSVNVPYLHYGSRTINRTPEAAAVYRRIFEEHRQRYIEKWGGLPEAERFEVPYDSTTLSGE